jgi:hypothetical protein
VLRWLVSGDIYSVPFARKLLWVMRRTRHVKHWLYTRSWRDPEIRPWLEKMARLGHVKVWFSCDRETGVPQDPVPRRVRLCWMQASHEDLPPEGVPLAFRIRRLRQVPTKRIGLTLVCPPEQGVPRKVEIHCDSCGICWR